jgi:glucose-6-phosphate isomerase
MLPKVNPTKTKAWKRLKEHCRVMKDLFSRDKARFSAFSVRFEDMLVDYSKEIIPKETMRLLFVLARECRVKDAVECMFCRRQNQRNRKEGCSSRGAEERMIAKMVWGVLGPAAGMS